MENRLIQHPRALCNIMRRIAVEAGELTLEYYDDAGIAAEVKADGSPVTEADRKAEHLIEQALADILPDIPFIGEEAVAQGRVPDLNGSDYYWLVDPLDGTKAFAAGSGEYTVNIALIHKGTPLAGVVYAPVPGELYAGSVDGAAIRYLEESGTEKEISVRPIPARGMTITLSSHPADQETLTRLLEACKVEKIVKCSSSLKICRIAAGKADLYPRMGPTREWDTAAAHAVLSAAGGVIRTLDGNELRYHGAVGKNFENPGFIACREDFASLLLATADIDEVTRSPAGSKARPEA